MDRAKLPTVRELRRLVKKRERPRFTAMWFLEPIQVYFSYVLIRLGLSSIHVTVLWLLVALAGYAVTAIGTPLAFIGGALLLYLKTILDGSDGEVARYRKQFVSQEEDLESFIHGVYLDKVFHIIEKPLWGLSLAFGLYRMTGEPWIFAAGVSLAVFHGFCRHNATLQQDIPRQFAEKAAAVFNSSQSTQAPAGAAKKDPIPVRAMDKLLLYMRNGKWFNLLVLLGASFDLVMGSLGYAQVGLFWLVVVAGCLSPVQMTRVIRRTISSKTLVQRAIQIPQGQ